jgi:hypothetical protein
MKYRDSIKTLTLIFCLLFAQLGQAFAFSSFESNNQHCDMQMQANSDSMGNNDSSATMDCCEDQVTNCCGMSDCQCSQLTTSIADILQAELLAFGPLKNQHIELAAHHIAKRYPSLPKRPPIFIYS